MYTWIFRVCKIAAKITRKKNYCTNFSRNSTSLQDPGNYYVLTFPLPPVFWPVLKLNRSRERLQSLRPRCWPRPPLLPNTWPGLPNKPPSLQGSWWFPKLADKKHHDVFQKKSCFKNSSAGFMLHTVCMCKYWIFIRYVNYCIVIQYSLHVSLHVQILNIQYIIHMKHLPRGAGMKP